MTQDAAVFELTREENLARALRHALHGAGPSLVLAGVRCRERRATALVAQGCAPREIPARRALPVGCLAKLLTATLAVTLFGRAGVRLETPLGAVLHAARSSAALERVTLLQLLEHTHGLDGSALDAPRFSERAIDAADLVRRAAASPPLAPPGALYSYGSVGAWLAAAALERLAGRAYAELLADELLARAAGAGGGELQSRLGSERVCAATGGALRLGVDDWLAILSHAAAVCDWPMGAAGVEPRGITPLPGWNPLERGVYRGWKAHGHGWFGHQSAWPQSSAFVRVNPARGLSVVLLAREHAASVIAARVFGRALPELFDLRAPRPIARPPLAELRRYCARYASAAWQVDVLAARDGLVLETRDRARGLVARAELAPAAGHTFFARPALDPFPYVQLVPGERDEPGAYLWNGRFALRRL